MQAHTVLPPSLRELPAGYRPAGGLIGPEILWTFDPVACGMDASQTLSHLESGHLCVKRSIPAYIGPKWQPCRLEPATTLERARSHSETALAATSTVFFFCIEREVAQHTCLCSVVACVRLSRERPRSSCRPPTGPWSLPHGQRNDRARKSHLHQAIKPFWALGQGARPVFVSDGVLD